MPRAQTGKVYFGAGEPFCLRVLLTLLQGLIEILTSLSLLARDDEVDLGNHEVKRNVTHRYG